MLGIDATVIKDKSASKCYFLFSVYLEQIL